MTSWEAMWAETSWSESRGIRIRPLRARERRHTTLCDTMCVPTWLKTNRWRNKRGKNQRGGRSNMQSARNFSAFVAPNLRWSFFHVRSAQNDAAGFHHWVEVRSTSKGIIVRPDPRGGWGEGQRNRSTTDLPCHLIFHVSSTHNDVAGLHHMGEV